MNIDLSLIEKYFANTPDIITGYLSAIDYQLILRRDINRKNLHKWEKYKSIIVIAKSYHKHVPEKPADFPRGRFSVMGADTDYHIQLRETIEGLAGYLSRLYDFRYALHVDTGPINERAVACYAGLAKPTRSGAVVSRLGSMFNIGLLLIDADLGAGRAQSALLAHATEPGGFWGSEKAELCADCRLCADACPTGAIDANDLGRCISYRTQTDNLTNTDYISDYLYGCDICGLSCPYNNGAEHGEFTDPNALYPFLDDILLLTQNEFDNKYQTKACYWIGLERIKRNARNIYGLLEQRPKRT